MSRQINNLNQRGCAFSIVLHDSGADVFKSSNYVLQKLITAERDVQYCAVIKHTLDYIQEEGRYKPAHYHIVITFAGSYRVQTVLNWLSELFHANVNQIGVEKCNSVQMQSRYLIHYDDKDKHPYSIDEVYTNNRELFNKYLEMIKVIVDVEDLFNIMDRYPSMKKLISVIGEENYRKWRTIIIDVRRGV